MLQKNTSGHTLTVMTDPPCEIEPGGLLEHDSPISGFDLVDAELADAQPVSHEAPDPSVGELPAAQEVVVADEPDPVADAPVASVAAEPVPVVETTPAESVAEPAPAAPIVQAPTAPVWPAQPGGTTVTAV